ncbi:MAG: hypothetical protein DRN29_01055 [Thermoplasmata archaeon]|nr:MAG: hypothetical protein DRN29_01055 [Thermoplasmata archaeon]
MLSLLYSKMFCVECGKKGKTYNGLCLDCYLKKKKFFAIPSEIVVTFCRNCDAYKIGSEWKRGMLWKDIEEYIKNQIKADIEYECRVEDNKVICYGKFEGREVVEEKEIKIKEKQKLCPQCSLKKGGYFEAVLQIRGAEKENLAEIEEIVKRRVKEKQSFISKKEKVRGGIDYYIGNKKAAEKAAKEIKEAMGGELTVSSSLVGMKDGKRIYRNTYSIRMPEYAGKFVKIDGKLYRIVSSGKKLELEGVDGKTLHVYKDELKRAVWLELEEREATVLHEDKDTLHIMDSRDFKTYVVRKPKKWKGGKKINIVEYEGKIYAVE